MKVAAIILLILQALSIFGSISNGQFGNILFQAITGGVAGISQMLGYFLPTIIALILLSRHNKKKQTAWLCPNCKTFNPDSIKVCQNCGIRKN